MITVPSFLTEEVKREIHARRGINRAWIVRAGDEFYLTLDEPTNERVIADVVIREGGDAHPTLEESTLQIDQDRPMVLAVWLDDELTLVAWGDFLLNQPLIGRPFIYGVFDCYEAVRAWKWQREREKLPPVKREEYGWWHRPMSNNPNLYLRLFQDMDYREFAADRTSQDWRAPRVGDGLLLQSEGSWVVNHVAIYVGDDRIYHHLQGRESEITSLPLILRSGRLKVRKWLRHADKLRNTAHG